MNLEFFGVLNVTPDSFSDGGQYLTLESALRQAESLSAGGCSVIDIGADSTRPGSACVGIEAEWMRIKDILPELCKKYSVSIDTHHAAIARKAIDCGAKFVNDVSSGSDPEMFPLIASSRVNYVLTFTCCSLPHLFDKKMETDIIGEIKTFFKLKIDKLLQLGVNQDRIILDPGMGAFLGSDSMLSWQVLARLSELDELGFPILLGISRKGFLRFSDEENITERDSFSALLGVLAQTCSNSRWLKYLRVHEVKLHKKFFSLLNSMTVYAKKS